MGAKRFSIKDATLLLPVARPIIKLATDLGFELQDVTVVYDNKGNKIIHYTIMAKINGQWERRTLDDFKDYLRIYSNTIKEHKSENKKLFQIPVHKITQSTLTIDVYADTLEEAQKHAIEVATTLKFVDQNIEYKI